MSARPNAPRGAWAAFARLLGAALAAAAIPAAPAPSRAGPPVAFQVEDGFEPKAEIERLAREAWAGLAQTWAAETGEAPRSPAEPIRIRREKGLAGAQAGVSRPGAVALRQARDWTVEASLAGALAHELAHQLLFASCPASAEDKLFHEAFAMSAAGELALWADEPYLSLPRARQALERARSLDGREARRALARLLTETAPPGGGMPGPIARRMRLCASGARWVSALSPAELADSQPVAFADAFVVLSRHSGEIVLAQGEWRRPMPFGSTLKPFLVAGAAGPAPSLPPRRGLPEWECGSGLPAELGVEGALLRSCNGYFLDWGSQKPSVAGMGAWGPALVALGLERAPRDVAEAIGIRPTLTLAPVAMAQAWRLLAEGRPDLLETLQRNAEEGTLSKLPESGRLAKLATKTGTVRDSQSRPELGWIVGVDRDFVFVMAKAGTQPRSFAGRFAEALQAFPPRTELAAVRVVVPEPGAEARCEGVAFGLQAGSPERLPAGEPGRAGRWPAMCLGGPWRAGERELAGVLSAGPDGRPLLRTTALAYAAGAAGGASRERRRAALQSAGARAAAARREGRVLCDGDGCRAFAGTGRALPGEADLLR